jgi:hypothetical protein
LEPGDPGEIGTVSLGQRLPDFELETRDTGAPSEGVFWVWAMVVMALLGFILGWWARGG